MRVNGCTTIYMIQLWLLTAPLYTEPQFLLISRNMKFFISGSARASDQNVNQECLCRYERSNGFTTVLRQRLYLLMLMQQKRNHFICYLTWNSRIRAPGRVRCWTYLVNKTRKLKKTRKIVPTACNERRIAEISLLSQPV